MLISWLFSVYGFTHGQHTDLRLTITPGGGLPSAHLIRQMLFFFFMSPPLQMMALPCSLCARLFVLSHYLCLCLSLRQTFALGFILYSFSNACLVTESFCQSFSSLARVVFPTLTVVSMRIYETLHSVTIWGQSVLRICCTKCYIRLLISPTESAIF